MLKLPIRSPFRFIVMLVCSGVLSTTGGCCTTNGLVKTPLADRARARYPLLGISIEIPKQPKDICARFTTHLNDAPLFQTNTHLKAQLTFGMHSEWSGALIEPIHLLVIYVARLTPNAFNDFVEGGNWYLNQVYGDHPESFREAISTQTIQKRIGEHKLLLLRKDVRLKGGDIVVAAATLVDRAIPDTAEDIKEIRAILNSIQPLDQ